MFKEIGRKIKEEWNKKTDPDAPIFTGNMVHNFLLRLLIMLLMYALINVFIVRLSVLKFIMLDALYYVAEWFVRLVRKR